MQLNKQTFRKLLILVGFGVLLNFAVQHLDTLDGAFSWVFAIIEPFVLGGVLAFILNVPMRAVERFLFPPKKTSVIETVLIKEGELQDKAGEVIRNSIPGTKKQPPKRPRFDIDRIRRPVSMIVTLLLVAAVVALVFGIVLPELIRTGTNLITNMPGYFESASVWVNKLLEDNPAILSYINDIIQQINLDEMSSRLMQFLQDSELIQNIFGTASSLVGGVVNAFIGLIFSFYILMRKEQLARQCKMILSAFLPRGVVERVVRIARLTSSTFSHFLSGQCTEAVILGFLFFIAMSVFKFPYALLCSVLIGFTALIPIFGAFFGCIVSALLILMVEPQKALWFVIMFLILQQVEGNLIYPHVVGSAVGLPSLWVLVAVTVGGSMFGILGMLFFIPLSSVLYALLRDTVYRRLRRRGRPAPASPPAAEAEGGGTP
ncbi:MAG TPA: AI-2E family transporter [Candidatus Faecivivens stercoravium]|uniref:AI-2E family transporter n=1 Tax=Candidatus Faecivivens stercoravium TaxID=2840803 RepID=A0A9D1J5L4_9FIRM|nr:AI-2E family transporter [Candidatus Faecivivens stercoravium]